MRRPELRRAVVLGFFVLITSPELLHLSIAHAQQSARPKRIEVLAVSVSEQSEEAKAFREGLRDAGYAEGRDIVIDWWHGAGRYDRVPEAVTKVLHRKPDVIVVEGTPVALAAKRATSTTPIVMAVVGDPVGSGIAASLAKPGGNVTGLTNQTVELTAKRLELLKEAIPKATRVAVVFNPESPHTNRMVQVLKTVGPELAVEPIFLGVRTDKELRSAFSRLSRKVDALLALDDAFMTAREETLLQMGAKARLPIVYGFGFNPLTNQGALISYAADHTDLFRRAAVFVDKIFKGAKPADLPIEQPTKFELVVNLKTAKALGITVPQSILVRADEIIR